jgi:hypothetical protein
LRIFLIQGLVQSILILDWIIPHIFVLSFLDTPHKSSL